MNETAIEKTSYARFENFPRRQLIFEQSRREFFRSFFREAQVTSGRLAGGKGYNLAALGALPDELLGQVKPAIISGCRINTRDGIVWGQALENRERFLLSTTETAALSAFNQFNGRSTVRQIAARLSEEMGWTPERSFAVVRGLFLTLVSYRLAQPAMDSKA